MDIPLQHPPLNILLADDDRDDRLFFDLALKELKFPTNLVTIEDGEKLMDYLVKNTEKLPDVLFLDLNMHKKNGSECLSEIKSNPKLNRLPVIIYSTSVHEDVADLLYKNGAHYYLPKRDFEELIKILNLALSLMVEKKFARPARDGFILN